MGIEERVKRAIEAGKTLSMGAKIDQALHRHDPVVRDSLGRVLEVGDEVVVIANAANYRVARIERVEDPGAPPNLMRIKLINVTEVIITCDGALDSIMRVRTASEMGVPQQPAQAQEAQEPPPAPSGREENQDG